MLERFSAITELLRHFYAILSRDGSQAPKPGTAAASKVERIIKKLDEILEALNTTKRSVQETQKNSKIDKYVSLFLI